MKDRKVWKILTALTTKEAEAFCRWLEAEMPGKQTYLRHLATVLCRDIKQVPTSEAVWQALYPDLPYDDDRLRKLASDLTAQLEEYLAILAFRRDREACDLYLIREMNRRKRPDVFPQLYRKIYDRLMGRTNKNADYYRMMYELEEEKQRFDRVHRVPYVVPKIEAGIDLTLDNMSQMQRINYAFDSWWLHEKMEIVPHNANSMQLHPEIIDSVLLEEVFHVIDHHPLHSQQPWLAINQRLYLLLQGEESVQVADIMRLLKERKNELEKKEVHALWGFLINHYARDLNKSGNVDPARHLISLYEWAIEEELILIDKYLPVQNYRNIITIALRISAFDLAHQHLHALKVLLPPERREDTFRHNLAKYHYAKEEYQPVIDILSEHGFVNEEDEIDARAFLLQAHYELNPADTEWLYNQAENLIRYIRKRKTLSDRRKQPYINQYRLFNRILNANTYKELQKMEQVVQETRPIIQPNWLNKMIRQRESLLAPK